MYEAASHQDDEVEQAGLILIRKNEQQEETEAHRKEGPDQHYR